MEKEYSEALYLEDKKLTFFIISRCCDMKLIEDSEQFFNDCLFDLFKARPLYDIQRGKYSTFVRSVISNCYLECLRNQNLSKCKSYFEIFSLDEPISNLDISIGDSIGREMQIDEIGVIDLIKKILSKSKNRCFIKSCYYFIQGYSGAEIAKKLGITRQAVNLHIQKFRNQLRQELAKVGYEI